MGKAKKKPIHIPMDQISKNIVSIFETVYKDDNKNSYKKGVKDLFNLYKQVCNFIKIDLSNINI